MTAAVYPIQILGAGSLGLGIGARLQASGQRVKLIARNPEAAPRSILMIAPDGSQSLGNLAPENQTPENQTTEQKLEVGSAFDPTGSLLVAVKAYDLSAALKPVFRSLSPATRVVLLSNGLGIFESVSEQMERAGLDPAAQLIRGLIYFGFRKESETQVRFSGDARWVLAGGLDEDRSGFARAFAQAGFSQVESLAEDPVRAEWSKSMLNLAINGICARERIANGEILESTAWLAEAKTLVVEAVQIASARGVDLGFVEQVWERVLAGIEATRLNRCSTLQDLEQGRKTEIPFLNGRIVDWAEALGLMVPAHSKIAAHFSSSA